jgi:hypothetical protein
MFQRPIATNIGRCSSGLGKELRDSETSSSFVSNSDLRQSLAEASVSFNWLVRLAPRMTEVILGFQATASFGRGSPASVASR